MDVKPLLALYDVVMPLGHFASASQDSKLTDAGKAHDLPDEPGVCVNERVEAFFARLAGEQTRFLDAMTEARRDLRSEPGQLAKAAALQGRLTQQFLDAQRSILRGRAEVDAIVARIVDDTEAEAAALIVTAHAQAANLRTIGDALAAAHTGDRMPIAEAQIDGPSMVGVSSLELVGAGLRGTDTPGARVEGNHRSVRQEIAELGAVVVRTNAEADSLASVIDAAFELDDLDGARAERQLRSLLDDWWMAEGHEGKAGVDDAHARAAMRLHVARIEAGEILETARAGGGIAQPAAEPIEQPTMLPPWLVTAFDTVDDAGLDSLLGSLLEALGDPHSDCSASEPCDDHAAAANVADQLSVVGFEENATVAGGAVTEEDAFVRFWGTGSAHRTRREARRWVFVQVLRPMAAVVAAVTLALAWIG